MILRDIDGIQWDCADEERDLGDSATDIVKRDFRVLRCVRVDDPEGSARHLSFPLNWDLNDASVQHGLLSGPRQRY